ncbi:class F sortase [Patescibacteria group bacterium]|nr:MAG: class F sortase [Patescibacteria group bacterium]
MTPEQIDGYIEPIAMDIDDNNKAATAKRWRWTGFNKVYPLYGLASLLFIFGLYVAIDGWMINRAAGDQSEVLAAQTDEEGVSGGGSRPSEAAPSSVHQYVVSPDMPRKLTIPSIGVSARVLRMGIRGDNQMEAPKNIYDTGWYSGSSKPTDAAGAILIDGHVSGPTKRGVFYNIKKLNTGDEISLERGDGQVSTFTVQRVETKLVSEVDMSVMMQSFDKTKLGLNLITCGGRFDASENKYESRTLVFAVQK